MYKYDQYGGREGEASVNSERKFATIDESASNANQREERSTNKIWKLLFKNERLRSDPSQKMYPPNGVKYFVKIKKIKKHLLLFFFLFTV